MSGTASLQWCPGPRTSAAAAVVMATAIRPGLAGIGDVLVSEKVLLEFEVSAIKNA